MSVDACNFFDQIGPDQLGHKLDVLKAHCDEVGRPFSEIELTVLASVLPGKDTAKDLIERVKALRAMVTNWRIWFWCRREYATTASLQTVSRILASVVARASRP